MPVRVGAGGDDAPVLPGGVGVPDDLPGPDRTGLVESSVDPLRVPSWARASPSSMMTKALCRT